VSVNELGKITVIAAIMGALLVAGLLFRPAAPEPAAVVESAPAEQAIVKQVNVLPPKSLEMLGPAYSEKAVFQDETIRIAFKGSFSEDGVESRLPFWLHNVSGGVVNVLWDRCSIQLPSGNTVNVVNEEGLGAVRPSGGTISIAPAGDLFDAVLPVSQLSWSDEGGWSVSTGILDKGTFTFVLALDVPVLCPKLPPGAPECIEPVPARRDLSERGCAERRVVYYTFRFVVR